MQKTVILACLSLLSIFASTAYAQLTKGVKFVGGNIGYSSSSSTYTVVNSGLPASQNERKETRQEFSFSPSIGAFVANNLAIGVSSGVSSRKYERPDPFNMSSASGRYTEVERTRSFDVSPFIRYYYLPVESFGFYGQLSAGYSAGRFRRTSDAPTSDNAFEESTQGAFAYITPAIIFFPINKLGLELTCGSIGYSRVKGKPESLQPNRSGVEYTSSHFGANFGLSSLTLGASYYLGR